MLKKTLFAFFFLTACWQPCFAQNKYSLKILPIEGFQHEEGNLFASMLANLFSKQKVFTVFLSSDMPEAAPSPLLIPPSVAPPPQACDSDYTLWGRVRSTGGGRLFILSIIRSEGNETLAGSQRFFNKSEEIAALLSGMVRELSSFLPPAPDSLSKRSPLSSDLIQELFEGGIRNVQAPPLHTPQGLSDTVALRFWGSPKGGELSLLFSRELSKRKGFSLTPHSDPRIALGLEENNLLPLTNVNEILAAKLGRMFNADMLLIGEVKELRRTKMLKTALINTKTLSRQNGGPWYFTKESELKSFMPSAVDELLGSQKNLPWDIILSRRTGTVHGLSVAEVLKNGLESRNNIGETPLVRAVRCGWTDLVELLLHQKASPRTADYKGWTALHWAASLANSELTLMLLEAGAPLNVQNSEGWTPLICAVIQGNRENASILLNAGANPRLKDKEGYSAKDWAGIKRFKTIEGLFTPQEGR